jgi:hypothetical protein
VEAVLDPEAAAARRRTPIGQQATANFDLLKRVRNLREVGVGKYHAHPQILTQIKHGRGVMVCVSKEKF